MLARDLVAFVGQPVKILVPYAANPHPEIQWSKNGSILNEYSNSHAVIENNDYLTQLNYNKCERLDSGTYTVRIENDNGSESVDIRFKVVDRPGPPEGPFEADDICPQSCRLSWKPSLDVNFF